MRRALALATYAIGCVFQQLSFAWSDGGGPGYVLSAKRQRFSRESAGKV